MAETPNADLPLIDDSMTADMPRDFNALAEAVDEAIGEIQEAIGSISVDIPDATLTTKGKVQLSSATNSTAEDRAATPKAVKDAMDAASGASGSLSTHIAATNVHGATSAATASRLIIRDAAGRAKVAAPAANDDIALLGSITKAQAGLGSVDNYGTATQAEAEAGTATNKFMTPQRTKQYTDTRLLNNLKFRVNDYRIEYNDGSGWFPLPIEGVPNWLAEFDVLNDGTDGVFNPVVNTTLTSGLYRFSSMIIPAGVTVSPSGSYLVLLVDGVANIAGTITASGKGSAGGTSSPAAGVKGKIAGGGGGGGGNNNTTQSGAGGNGNDENTILGGGVGVPGNPGQSTSAALIDFYNAFDNYVVFAGAGGGRGGGAVVPGGAGGGVIIVVARSITGLGAIRADGLAGSNNSSGAGAGGGGGGLAAAVAWSLSELTVTANGGAGGLPSSGNIAGGAGGNGFAIKILR